MPPLIVLVLIFAALALTAWWLHHQLRRALQEARPDAALSVLQAQLQESVRSTAQQIESLQAALRDFAGQVSQSLSAARSGMDQRLDHTARVVQDVGEKLARLDEASKRIFEIGQEIGELQNILRAPKFRGQLGELFLEELLKQVLPPKYYALQHAFSDGQKVDAVIILKAGLVPVDAKFPLENFRALQAAPEAEQAALRRVFLRDVRKHIDAISAKYIRPAEGTLDFALMYVPAENVYYEIVLRGDGDADLLPYALQKRVIPVSPYSFYAYLQTILLGLKGLQIEERAREMLDQLSGVRHELDTLQDEFETLGTHLDNAQKRFGVVASRLLRIVDQVKRLESGAGELGTPQASSRT